MDGFIGNLVKNNIYKLNTCIKFKNTKPDLIKKL